MEQLELSSTDIVENVAASPANSRMQALLPSSVMSLAHQVAAEDSGSHAVFGIDEMKELRREATLQESPPPPADGRPWNVPSSPSVWSHE